LRAWHVVLVRVRWRDEFPMEGMAMLSRLSFTLAIAALVAGGLARGAEPEPGLKRWDEPGKDPVLARLKTGKEQKAKIAEVYKAYTARRGQIREKYAQVRMAMLRRGMYRDFSECDTKFLKKFKAALTADQRRRYDAGVKIEEDCEEKVDQVRDELAKLEPRRKGDPKGYARLKTRCEKLIAALEADRLKKLDRQVGELPGKKK